MILEIPRNPPPPKLVDQRLRIVSPLGRRHRVTVKYYEEHIPVFHGIVIKDGKTYVATVRFVFLGDKLKRMYANVWRYIGSKRNKWIVSSVHWKEAVEIERKLTAKLLELMKKEKGKVMRGWMYPREYLEL